MKTKAKTILLSGLIATLASLPATADDTIRAGSDVWETQGDGRTYTDLALPAGFFCAASAPFSGRITLVGVPIATDPSGAFGKADTVIERLGDATFDANGIATVNAIVRAISFKSTAPVAVSGCAGSIYWDVRSVASPSQSPFAITIRRASPTATGGSFDSSVSVAPRLIFTQQGSGLRRVLDQPTIIFTTQGAEWTHTPGAGGVTCSGSPQIDTDGDNIPETLVRCTSNFAPGWSPVPQPNCATAPCRVPIPHQAPKHYHWVWPPPPQRCLVTASCGDGTTVSCQGSASTSICSAVDRNCSVGERGHVTCDGVTTYCNTACSCTTPCCRCEATTSCVDCCRCDGGTLLQCNQLCGG